MFGIADAALTDISVRLPDDDQKRIDRLSLDLHYQTPREDQLARREASAKIERFSRQVHDRFLESQTRVLRAKYADRDSLYIFDPAVDTLFHCPQCMHESLVLRQVVVIAFCTKDCGHNYPWCDSEERGCPKCGHRPHAFRTESEDQFAGLSRTLCSCPCSSVTDAVSPVDGYCPKCGGLPVAYSMNGGHFCGVHHEPMKAYDAPGNFLFIETESRWAAERFPNAKHWGDAPAGTDAISGSYCASCEADRQRWLASHGFNKG